MATLIKTEVLFFMILICEIILSDGRMFSDNPQNRDHPCINTTDVSEIYETNQPPDGYEYTLSVSTFFTSSSDIQLKFDSDANITLISKIGRITYDSVGKVFDIRAYTGGNRFNVNVQSVGKSIPSILSIIVDHDELCPGGSPKKNWNDFVDEPSDFATSLNAPERQAKACGKKQLEFSELITSAQGTKPGDWPWHVAIFRTKTVSSAEQSYICGGSLISTRIVVTAGHCVVENNIKIIPERLHVALGKHNIIGGDIAHQEKGIYEIILHSGFSGKTLSNDIALLKLSSEVSFGEYVQPICMWAKSKKDKTVIVGKPGTVVGWGLTETGVLSTELGQATMPVASDYDCLQSYPVFYERFLNDKTFCAGFRNGTSVCNGDSGGGMYFSEYADDGDVIWSLRGLVSVSVSQKNSKMCDPSNYVVFTDVANYLDWIESKM